MFLLSRSGKRSWIFGQVFYVIFVSFIYMAFIFLCFCLFLLPNLAFDAENWGKIMRSVASTDIGSSVGMRFSPKISVLGDFAPLEGFIYAFGTAFSVSVILGLVILSLNMIVNHNSGIVVSGGLIFFYMFSKMLGGYVFNYFSPLIWCSLTIADKHGISALPDVPFVIVL